MASRTRRTRSTRGASEVVDASAEAPSAPAAAAVAAASPRPALEGIRFYHKPDYSWLSNFYDEAPFTLRGVRWDTVEHYFQAAKFFNTDAAYAEVVRGAGTPAEAKRAGRSRAHPLDPAWEEVKEGVMAEALAAKFAAGSDLAARLVATAPHALIEDAPRDYYWGAGARGTGKNRLGVLLVAVRTALIRGTAAGGGGGSGGSGSGGSGSSSGSAADDGEDPCPVAA